MAKVKTMLMAVDDVVDAIGGYDAATSVCVMLDLSTWTRLAEVDEYARRRNIDRADAVRELVNSGLSHHRESLVTEADRPEMVSVFSAGDELRNSALELARQVTWLLRNGE